MGDTSPLRPTPNDHRPWETYPEWAEAGGYYKYFWWGNSRSPDDYSYDAVGRWVSSSSWLREPTWSS